MRFHTRTEWQLPGLTEKNVFPVGVARKPWYLDAGRANPQLKVTRGQFPLAPDFAGTTHALQGYTAEHGAIVDVQGNADPIAVYVGMTRCRSRQKLLIYRPFPLAPLQAGLPLGRQLLLDVWKQERIDWDALRNKYLDERPCMECNERKRKDGFTKASGTKTATAFARSARRKNVMQALHTGAANVVCGMPPATFPQSI